MKIILFIKMMYWKWRGGCPHLCTWCKYNKECKNESLIDKYNTYKSLALYKPKQ